MNLTEWIDGLISKKRDRGYSEAELAEYRAGLEVRYAGLTEDEFGVALTAAAKARRIRDRRAGR